MNTFGVKELKEFQKETVDNLLDGKNFYLHTNWNFIIDYPYWPPILKSSISVSANMIG